MSLLQSDRDTEYVPRLERDMVPLDAYVSVFNGGALACAGGYARPAGPGKKHFRGIADQTVSNSGGAAGAASVNVLTPEGAYWDSATTFTQANIGQMVWFADDHTVTLTAGNCTYAGRVRSIDPIRGVLVDHRGAYAEFLTPAVTTAG